LIPASQDATQFSRWTGHSAIRCDENDRRLRAHRHPIGTRRLHVSLDSGIAVTRPEIKCENSNPVLTTFTAFGASIRRRARELSTSLTNTLIPTEWFADLIIDFELLRSTKERIRMFKRERIHVSTDVENLKDLLFSSYCSGYGRKYR